MLDVSVSQKFTVVMNAIDLAVEGDVVCLKTVVSSLLIVVVEALMLEFVLEHLEDNSDLELMLKEAETRLLVLMVACCSHSDSNLCFDLILI